MSRDKARHNDTIPLATLWRKACRKAVETDRSLVVQYGICFSTADLKSLTVTTDVHTNSAVGATMSSPAPELQWNEWLAPLASDLDLDCGLTHMQGSPPNAGSTRERSLPQERPIVDQPRLQANASQSAPRFLHPTAQSQELEQGRYAARFIRYDIEWKLIKNKRSIYVNTERMVKVAPSVHWREILKSKIAMARSANGLDDTQATLVDTSIVVLKTGRPANKVFHQFKGLEVVWTQIEEDMEEWAHQLKPDQMLKIELSVKWDTKRHASAGTKTQAGRSSATKRMLADRGEVIMMEQRASGKAPLWPANFESVRCSDGSCDNQGRHCRVEARTGKHIPLQHREFRELTERSVGSLSGDKRQMTQAGNTNKRKRKVSALEIPSSCSPGSVRGKTPSSRGSMASPFPQASRGDTSRQSPTEIAKLFGFEGEDPVKVLRQYGAWQLSQTDDEVWQEGNRKAEAAALRMNLDVVQIGFEVGHECLVNEGVPLGAALRWHRLVAVWAKERQRQRRLQEITVSV